MNSRGTSLIEIIIASSIILFSLISIWSVFSVLLHTSLANTEFVQATALIEEGTEVMKHMRNASWSGNIATLSVNTPYYINWNNGWSLSATPSLIDGKFTRKIVLTAVSRNSSGKIVTSGGTNDPNTRLMAVTLSWTDSAGKTINKSMSTYLINF